MHEQGLKMLQNMPLFGALREDVLEILLKHAEFTTVPASHAIFREGDVGISLFVLERGQAQVICTHGDLEYIVHTLQSGDCFGEMALVDMGPRSASVVTTVESQLIEITRHHLLEVHKHDPNQFALLQMNISREICRRLRKTDAMLLASRARLNELPRRTP